MLTVLAVALTTSFALSPIPSSALVAPRSLGPELGNTTVVAAPYCDSGLTMDFVRKLAAAKQALAKLKKGASDTTQAPMSADSAVSWLKASPSRRAVLKRVGLTPGAYVRGRMRLQAALMVKGLAAAMQQVQPGVQVDPGRSGASTEDVAFVTQHKAELEQLGFNIVAVQLRGPGQSDH